MPHADGRERDRLRRREARRTVDADALGRPAGPQPGRSATYGHRRSGPRRSTADTSRTSATTKRDPAPRRGRPPVGRASGGSPGAEGASGSIGPSVVMRTTPTQVARRRMLTDGGDDRGHRAGPSPVVAAPPRRRRPLGRWSSCSACRGRGAGRASARSRSRRCSTTRWDDAAGDRALSGRTDLDGRWRRPVSPSGRGQAGAAGARPRTSVTASCHPRPSVRRGRASTGSSARRRPRTRRARGGSRRRCGRARRRGRGALCRSASPSSTL